MSGQAHLTFNGNKIKVEPGQTAGAALAAAGITSWRTTRKGGKPRGLFCGIGICFDCLITVDGEPNQRACLVPARDGITLQSDGCPVPDAAEKRKEGAASDQ